MAAARHTDEQIEALTFGRLLSSLRTEKGIDLQAVSDETRIAPSTLRLLEAEAYEELPDPVFIKGFIKSYAEAIDTPAEPIIQKFITGREYYLEKKRIEAGRGKKGLSVWPWLGVAAAVLLIVLVSVFRSAPSPEHTVPLDVAGDRAEQGGVPAGTEPLQEAAAQPEVRKPAPQASAYLLQIIAVEETWLKIIVDRQDPKQYSLNPGDRLELKAASGFNLLIGSATGIHLMLNDQAVPVDGRQGQVVTLKLPK